MKNEKMMNEIKTDGPSKIYRRETISSLPPTDSGSLRYWRAQARQVFERYPSVSIVECVIDGCKTSSQLVDRGIYEPPAGSVVIVASTGGRWGRSRREYYNREEI